MNPCAHPVARPAFAITAILTGIILCASISAQEEPPTVTVPDPSAAFPAKIEKRAREEFWLAKLNERELTRPLLTKSIELARTYYLNQQLPAGNFVYSRDIVANEIGEDDNQVRQAGALWGLSSLNRDRHTTACRRAVVRGLDFFYRCSTPLKLGRIAPLYPGSDEIKTGTVALVSLAIIELWRGQEKYLTDMGRGLYDSWLDTYLAYLQHMELETGGWGRRYIVPLNQREAETSPYYDGECLLAYCRAARYMDRHDLIPKIERIAPLLARRYTIDAWQRGEDSDNTKGFFQWGCLAFAEHVEAGWKHAGPVGDAALALTWWQIHEYAVEARRGNTAYAVEGLLGAYRVARARGDRHAMRRFREISERILVKLISWQVGGPLEDQNPYLRDLRAPKDALGGFMSSADSGYIRIDVVQHQVNAMLMALELFFPESG